MKRGTLIIFSGLPGCGKSTLATSLSSTLSATYLRIDTIEQGLRDFCEISEIDEKGYHLAHRIAQDNLRLGCIVIADSVNPWDLTRKGWNSVAEELDANFVNFEIVCSDKEEHKRRVETRVVSVPGLKSPTWEEILQRDYHPWIGDRVQIDTHGKTTKESLNELLAALKVRQIFKGSLP
jgi:predicted kinase